MARMTAPQLEDFLGGTDHRGTAILSVCRPDRGPLSVPLSFSWTGQAFRVVTKPSRRHAQAFVAAGRATLMVHHEDYESGVQIERYVMAEGPIGFVGGGGGADSFQTAELTPTTLYAVIYDFSG